MRQNYNGPLIENMLNEDYKIIVHTQKPKIKNFLLIIINFAILAEQKTQISIENFNFRIQLFPLGKKEKDSSSLIL
jgi:hypothetical protein